MKLGEKKWKHSACLMNWNSKAIEKETQLFFFFLI